MSNDNIKPTKEELDAYTILAKKSLAKKVSLVNQARLENSELAEKISAPSSSPFDITASAQLALASAFIHSWLYTNTPLVFKKDGNEIGKLNYRGEAWGVALGGGVLWATGWMADPNSLIGDADFALSTSPVYTEIAFFKKGVPVGVLIAGGINVQVGGVGGSGKFTKA